MPNKKIVLKKRLKKYLTRLNNLKFELDKRQCVSNTCKPDGDDGCFRGKKELSQSTKLQHPKRLPEYVTTYCDLDEMGCALLDAALCARFKAYCPYSQFRVGAAFRASCGLTFSGCNVENVAFTPGCCAERIALGKAVSEGHQLFLGGAVVAHHPSGFVTPCGVCRQFMHEFAKKDFPIYVGMAPKQDDSVPMIADDAEVLVTSVYNLLPHGFTAFECN